MPTPYAKHLKELRAKKGFSQANLASRLGISRPSYIAVEQGKRELTLGEAEKLSAVFGVSLKELEQGAPANYEKFKQMILAFIRSAGGSDGRITKTKLAKLVYLADFAWFYEHLESMSGMPYRKITYGPVPNEYFRAVTEMYEAGILDITPRDGALLISEAPHGKKLALSEINKDEEKLIQTISKKWKDKTTKDIVVFTHNQLPYSVCLDNEIIPYELITQENPEDVY